MPRRIVVVGGVAAGAGAAAKARREDENAEILVFEKGPHVSFANCGLPYFVGGEIEARESLLVQTPEALRARFRLDVRVLHEVTRIDTQRREVEVVDLRTGRSFVQPYDALVLAMGARGVVPELPGVHAPNVRLLRTVEDAVALRAMVEKGARRAVVVGAGFIGLEAAENLRRQGLEVTLVEKMGQVLPPLDSELTTELLEALVELGVRTHLGTGVQRFVTEGETAVAAELDDGTRIDADLFVLSIGVRPNVELATRAGIALGPSRAIAVDERMETNVPGVFAAGDVAELRQLASGREAWMALAGPANKAGRVAGANAAGRDMRFRGALGTAIVRVGRKVAGKTGLGQKDCARLGIACRVTYTTSAHHASYYPGARNLTIALVTKRESGRLLGAQVVGEEGVDKRLDVFATALHAGMHVADLEELDLAYAPPFGAAKDPVIMAAMTHANAWRGEVPTLTPREAAPLSAQSQVVDVRSAAEHARGAVANAILLPLPELRDRVGELDPAQRTIVYCQGGQRSAFAVRALRQLGFRDVWSVTGGWRMIERCRAADAPPR